MTTPECGGEPGCEKSANECSRRCEMGHGVTYRYTLHSASVKSCLNQTVHLCCDDSGFFSCIFFCKPQTHTSLTYFLSLWLRCFPHSFHWLNTVISVTPLMFFLFGVLPINHSVCSYVYIHFQAMILSGAENLKSYLSQTSLAFLGQTMWLMTQHFPCECFHRCVSEPVSNSSNLDFQWLTVGNWGVIHLKSKIK